MFDDLFGMAGQCAENFRSSVRDDFGASIVTDILEPVCAEIGLLRSFHEDFQRQSRSIDLTIQEARSFQIENGTH